MNDKDFAEITQFYQENIRPLVPHIGEELGYMIDAHPVELILEAFNWENQLLKTLDEVNAADQRPFARKAQESPLPEV